MRVGSAQLPNETLSSHTSPRSAAALFPPEILSERKRQGSGRVRAFFLALAVGSLAVWAAWTGMQAVHRGPDEAAAQSVSPALIKSRLQQLDEFEHQLDAALAKKTPALPKVPKFPPVRIPDTSPPSTSFGGGPAFQVVYVYDEGKPDEHHEDHHEHHEDHPDEDKVDGEHH